MGKHRRPRRHWLGIPASVFNIPAGDRWRESALALQRGLDTFDVPPAIPVDRPMTGMDGDSPPAPVHDGPTVRRYAGPGGSAYRGEEGNDFGLAEPYGSAYAARAVTHAWDAGITRLLCGAKDAPGMVTTDPEHATCPGCHREPTPVVEHIYPGIRTSIKDLSSDGAPRRERFRAIACLNVDTGSPTPGATVRGANDDDVHDLLDELAKVFSNPAFSDVGIEGAYHHVRAVAHRRGYHLTGCAGGKRRA